MKISAKRLIPLIAAVAVITIVSANAMLLVTVANVGTIVGPVAFKELTISAQSAVTVLGTGTKPVCSALAATAFADVATSTLNWGTTLQSGAKYETFFCLQNIGNIAGTVHVAINGAGALGDKTTISVFNSDALTAGTPCDGTVLGAGGRVGVQVEMDAPTVAVGATSVLASTILFTIA